MTAADRAGFAATITVNFGALDHDVHIELPARATVADLYRLLGSPESGLGFNRTPPLLTNERSGRGLGPDERLLADELISGDRLVALPDHEERASGSSPTQVLELEFLNGPRRGERFVVADDAASQSIVIGRGTNDGFDHASISRRHVHLELTAAGVCIGDLGSTNGTRVNGIDLEPGRAVVAHPGDVVEVGEVSFTVTGLPTGRRATTGAPFTRRGGLLELQPAPRAAEPQPRSTLTLPDPPTQPPKRRFPIGAAVLPVVMGVVMAVIFSPIFAVFMAMSPLMVIWTYLDDRRSGRRAFADDRAAFLADLEARRLAVLDASDQLAAWHRRRTPRLDQIARWVRCGSLELWSRRPRHDDFLTVAVGTADQPSSLTVVVPERGAADLLAEAQGVAAAVSVEHEAPVAVDLGRHPVIGFTGGRASVDVARSVLAELAGLRSPRDLELVIIAPEHQHEWEWTKWLPHTASAGEVGLEFRRAIAADDDEASALFAELQARVDQRRAAAGERMGSARAGPGPHVVVVLQPPVGLSPSDFARFVEEAPLVGMSVLYLAADRHELPAETSLHMDVSDEGLSADVHDLAAGSVISGVEPWRTGVAQATVLARDLAPLVDVTASAAEGGVPSAVNLLAVHDDGGASLIGAEAMARRWESEPAGLVATFGVDGDGPVIVDFEADGPHGLVAGTTGSGKSELLQTVIADLAARHSPADLNFILIDYKGGSAFRECERFPHTVGFVTDLDEHLAARALISLRAELRHRERVLAELGVSDLRAMRSKFRHSVNADLVLPSLMIVIDEFAALRTEVPDFVDGLVDVAQRGRSMGVHMVLATQKPGGVITPQIDANTNIRVALRVASEADSRDLLGVTDAAHIATGRPGRGLLKIGGGSTVLPFQSAYVGGRSFTGGPTERVGLSVLGYGMRPGRFRPVDLDRPSSSAAADVAVDVADDVAVEVAVEVAAATDLERIVDAAGQAWRMVGGGVVSRRPWLPPLAVELTFGSLFDDTAATGDGGSRSVPIGLADRPEAQAQEAFHLDLARAGHVAIYGSSGSGKTSLLRTLAGSLSASMMAGGDPVVIYGVDFASGLRAIESLPTVADVVGGDELERLQLLVAMLESEVAERLRSGSESGSLPPAIVVMIDGFGPFWDTLESFDFGRQADRFARLLTQAPSVGVHVVMTADQRSAIPFNCLGSIGLRLLQRLASPDEYRSLGLGHAPNPEAMVPGRTLVVDGPEVQVALISDADIVDLTNELRAAGGSIVSGPPVRALAEVVRIDEVRHPVSLSSVALGLGPAHEEVTVDLADQPTLLVAGAAGSGRSTTLTTLAAQLAPVVADRRAFAPKRTSPIGGGGPLFSSVVVGDDVPAALVDVAAEIEDRARAGYEHPMAVVVDDADVFFDDSRLSAALNTIVLKGRDAGVVVLMAVSSFRAGTAYETWIRALRSNGHGVVLQPDGDKEEDLFDVRFPRGSALRFPVGRGYLVVRSGVRAVQVAVSQAEPGPGPGGPSAPLSEGRGRMGQ